MELGVRHDGRRVRAGLLRLPRLWQPDGDCAVDAGGRETHRKDGAVTLSTLRDSEREKGSESTLIADPRSLLIPLFLFFCTLGSFSETFD